MADAQKIGRMTRQFSRLHKDELQETLDKYRITFPKKISDGDWFIRTERTSLKNGQYGVGPYNSLENIIKSLVSSNPTHECFKPDDQFLDLYFVPFIQMDWRKEFRVFVYHGQVTAISVQSIYDRNTWINGLNDEQKKDIVLNIKKYHEDFIHPRISTLMTNYTYDFVFLGQNLQPYFIEVNPFGSDYAVGAALFGWKQDHHTLTDSTIIELRLTKV